MSCPTGTWCPTHPDLPGALALTGLTLLAGAAVCLALALATAIRTAARRRTPTPAADTRPTIADIPHLVVVAAALDDWWTTTDPGLPFDSHDVAAHVEMYLLSSGYHVAPAPASPHTLQSPRTRPRI